MKIELLDYTIRASLSGKAVAKNIQEYDNLSFGLAEAGIENIELGYLADDENWLCKPIAERIEDYYTLAVNRKATYSVMLHPLGYDIEKLPICSGEIQRIRVLLRQDDKAGAIALLKSISAKGYKTICDIEKIYEYSDLQLLQLAEELNEIPLDQVTIIDDTKLMDVQPVRRVALLLDNNLPIEVKIGLRSGENNGMAQFIVNSFLGTPLLGARTVVVEGSLLGIGFISSNLCTECIADQLNEGFGCDYDYEHLITLISIFIPGVNCDPGDGWGYHPIFYLAAKNQVDTDYGRYFLAKGVMLYKANDLLRKVAETERFKIFEESIAERIYHNNEVT